MKIAILPGDGIGTEIVAQAERVLGALDLRFETSCSGSTIGSKPFLKQLLKKMSA